ncbi:MAG: InlB B-repeat-containing protein [Christensenellaceae bacterium]
MAEKKKSKAVAITQFVVFFVAIAALLILFFAAANRTPAAEPTTAPPEETVDIIFENLDGTTISVHTYPIGATVSIPDDPVYGPDERYTYRFIGWFTEDDTPVETIAASDRKYTARYTTSPIAYYVRFLNYDDTVLYLQSGFYGEQIVYSGSVPKRPADQQYVYTFSGWDAELDTITGNLELHAVYEAGLKLYPVTFLMDDGSSYAVADVGYGEDGTYAVESPYKEPTQLYTYEFVGWDRDLSSVREAMTVYAVFRRVDREYTIIFNDRDGSLISKALYRYGENVEIPAMSTLLTAVGYFAGWDKSVTAVTQDETYTAQYSYVQAFFDLTVEYLYSDGTQAATTVRQSYACGANFAVTSPQIPYFKPDTEVISGSIYGDVTYQVFYTLDYTFRKDSNGYNIIDTAKLLEIVSLDDSLWSQNYSLASDLSLDGIDWKGIGSKAVPFSGVFDGKGYTIYDMNYVVNQTSGLNRQAGCFNVVTGTVKNLAVVGSITADGAQNLIVGGVVGELSGTVENCRFIGEITLSSSRNIQAGGVVGFARESSVTYASATQTTSAVSSAGYVYLGGIVGNAVDSTVRDCTAAGVLKGSANPESVNALQIAFDAARVSGSCVVTGNDGSELSINPSDEE